MPLGINIFVRGGNTVAVVQNLYQIFKFPASFLVQNNCDIKNYSRTRGIKEGNVVSIGDNLVFQQLRYIHNDYRDHRELFAYVSKLRNNVHYYKKQGMYKEARILEQQISKVLFVDDIVNVVVDGKKTDFHEFRVKGFNLNGAHYVYLCSGSGQIRRNTATFINEKYQKQILKILNCGLDEKTSMFVLAKYSAYFALAFSSILWVRTPRVCVIKDFYNTLKGEPVDFVLHDKNGKGYIEERKMDIELNCADGQGLIDPQFALLWAQDMDLSFTPCSFVARSCFIKGNLVTFDFKEYARAHGITTIRDKWGQEYLIDDIDVLLSESQFKTHKYYSSWQEYCRYAESGNIHWGVARYNKKKDEEYVLANYQYIQALTLSEEDIQQLIAPTAEWIKQICSGDPAYALLFAFGGKDPGARYNDLFGTAQTPAMKAIVKNINFLNDTYIRQKIYKSIAETINRAKLGKIWIRGNYQFMIADPVAQCQAALGLPAVGLLKKDQVYSKFWIDRDMAGKIIDTCRSPMIDVSEHNPIVVAPKNEEMEHWYQYLPSGIIYSIYDTSCFRHSDSDYDGDIVLSTDNAQFIKGSHKAHNIITYEKGLATPEKMTVANITKTVMKGFGTGVGGFSNTATILYSMAAIFDKPGHEDQYAEIMMRIKLLREIVGQEIDRIKGADKPSLPKEWRQITKILETDTQDEIIAKMRQNAMVVNKKPYFFRYLYPELNQRFKQFEASYNQISRDMFGIKFKKLLKKEDKTEEEKMLVRRYQKYSPLITAPCTMNRLCREFENINFDIKFFKDSTTGAKKANVSMLPTFAEIYADKFDSDRYAIVKKMYQDFQTKIPIKHLENLLQATPTPTSVEDFHEMRTTVYDEIIRSLQSTLTDANISGQEFLYYCSCLAPKYTNFNWGFAWSILEDQIVALIPRGQTLCPIRDLEEGTITYLGERYRLDDVSWTPPPSAPDNNAEEEEAPLTNDASEYYSENNNNEGGEEIYE